MSKVVSFNIEPDAIHDNCIHLGLPFSLSIWLNTYLIKYKIDKFHPQAA